MSSIFDLEKLVEISIDAFVELMRVDVGFIMLFDEKSQQLSVEAVKGLKRHTLRKTRINVDKDIIQGLIERKDAIFLSKLEKETLPIRILFQKIVEKVGGDIVLSIPLVIKKDLLGLVNLSRREFEAPFKQTDLQFLYTLAGYVAIAIENANLHRKKIEVEKSRIIEHKRSEEKTREYSKNLERMVKERTKELSRALYDTEESRDKIDGILKSIADGLASARSLIGPSILPSRMIHSGSGSRKAWRKGNRDTSLILNCPERTQNTPGSFEPGLPRLKTRPAGRPVLYPSSMM
jgi:transcriptional regulator with GAF, ATPase, and Fis domain